MNATDTHESDKQSNTETTNAVDEKEHPTGKENAGVCEPAGGSFPRKQKTVGNSGTVTACPECDMTNVCPHSRGSDWHCKSCGADFSEPVRRERRHEAKRPAGTPARALEEMTVEEFDDRVRTDGGSTPCGRRTCDEDATVTYTTHFGAHTPTKLSGIDGLGPTTAASIAENVDQSSVAKSVRRRRLRTDGGQTEFSGSGASPSATDAIIDYLEDLDDVRITTAKRLAPDIDGVGTRTVGIVLGKLAQSDDAPVDVTKWDDETSGASVWHIDPPNPKVTATDGGPYTVPTGENYVTTYRVNQEIRLTSSDLARIGVELGDEISALASRNGIRVVPGEHENAIQVSEAKKLDGRMLKAEFYRPVMNALGVVTGEDVRIYDVDEEDALEIVAADGDPFVDDDQDEDEDQLVTDGGQDDADVMSGRPLDEEDARHPSNRIDAALKQLRLARDELDEDAFAYHGVEKAIDEAERASEWLDHTPMTDGGQQFYIVDEQRRAIVAGPFPTRIAAQAADEADDPHTIIVSERALDFAKSERPIRDETGDIDVVTDGGLPEVNGEGGDA